jgi:hypothetical protein
MCSVLTSDGLVLGAYALRNGVNMRRYASYVDLGSGACAAPRKLPSDRAETTRGSFAGPLSARSPCRMTHGGWRCRLPAPVFALCLLASPILHGAIAGCADSDSAPGYFDSRGAAASGGNDSDAHVLPVDDGSLGDGDYCSAQSQDAVRAPLDMYIMMDVSGSMAFMAGNTNVTKWSAITKAMSNFLTSAASDDIGVGIQFFPILEDPSVGSCAGTHPCPANQVCLQSQAVSTDYWCYKGCSSSAQCGAAECVPDGTPICSNVSCEVAAYTRPEVEIVKLPGGTQAVVSAMSNHTPREGTPSVPAIQGALAHAKQWAGQHPERKVVVVLATDGLPTLCPMTATATETQRNIDMCSAAASGASSGSPSIKTFVIGVLNATENYQGNLDAIAIAGGTSKSFIVDVSQDVTKRFAEALEEIRGGMACEFKLPTVGQGTLDYMKVNVVYTPGVGDSQPFYYVGDVSKCDPKSGGWYYDANPDIATPSRILLCPASCSSVKAATSGKVDVEIGCKTVTQVR